MTRRERDLGAVLAGVTQRVQDLEADRARAWRELWDVRRRLAVLEAQAQGRGTEHVPLAEGACRLGVTRQHALRLGQGGALELRDERKPGARRPRWAVSAESVERLLARRRDVPSKHTGGGDRPSDSGKE